MSLDTLRKVPELSLLSYVEGSSQDKVKFIDNLYNGIKDYGFIILVDHIVKDEIVQNGYDAVKNFFDLETQTKMKYVSEAGGGQRGYTAFGIEHAKDHASPDLKEFWHTGREVEDGHKWAGQYPKNIWPTEVENFRKNMEELYNGLDKTSEVLLEALGKALDVESGYFAKMIDKGNSILRAIHYPPIPNDVPVDAVRAAAHEDINLITILVGATDSGLELLDRDNTWLPVSTKPGQLVVDSGDMLKVLTNDVIPATTHRVVNPEDTSTRRFSMPFFVHPNPDTTLACIESCKGEGEKYAPINAHEFLLQRLREIGLK